MADEKTNMPLNSEVSAGENLPVGGDSLSSVAPVITGTEASTTAKKKRFERRPADAPRQRRNFREERVRPEYDQKIINIRRVARVTAGGKRFNLSVALAIGNRRGSAGVGTGKGADTSLAIDKAMRNAKKNLIKVNMTKSMSIPHGISAKYSSAMIMMMPAPRRGLIAGSALRDILELAGIHDVNGKILSGSKNKLNIARATIKALSELKKPVEAKAK